MAPSEPMLPVALAPPDHDRPPRRHFAAACDGAAVDDIQLFGIYHSYDKPFFVVYMNTSVFAVSLIPMLVRFLMQHGVEGLRREAMVVWNEQRYGKDLKIAEDEEDTVAGERLLVDDEPSLEMEGFETTTRVERLTFRETAVISLEFCMLWFFANYFASACLEYTSVGSVTILNSTSSVWTLVFCAVMGVEGFTARKLIGVLASLTGIVLISTVDLSGSSDENRGSFPHKTTGQIAIGDLMAFVSAIIYGLYVTVMKRRVGNEDRVNMPLFFGLVGLFNLVFLWPVFFILHFTGMEPFSFPPTAKIWAIVIGNSLSSFISDMSWAYAMLLTTPLVVTVGLSLTIPLSLIGEMIQYSQYSSWVYWVGAAVVLISFLFINNESHEDESSDKSPEAGSRGVSQL
ncbi:thiamine-repressible mitochondrial transporter THI74 [Colletotrichum acutatum]|uniref:Thiamine-repressible mitochondrial transporter THI74 n=1 Tax=Glomerella acutata TaxID=27357 RepID=A0AAD8XMB1_GLOAC|nr:thiamine-repressible mitochondrial transporter THI74 [Colletotrichum acutatum]KAK1729933.1 thiamine-repressible mitochondrial transporter THI74 [Colletotrichum acutatum]